MAFNPSPKVAAARDYGRKYGKDVVVIVSFDENFGRYEIVSWGKNRELCQNGKIIGDELEKAVKELELQP